MTNEKTPEDIARDLAASHAEALARAAEQTVEPVIGARVLALLEHEPEITVDDLIRSFQAEIDAHTGRPDLNPEVASARAAINRLLQIVDLD